MNVSTVFILAGIAGVVTFARDIVAQIRTHYRNVTERERAQLREPVEIRGMILDNTRDAVSLQSALLLDLRQDVTRLRDENAIKDLEIAELRKKNAGYEKQISDLYSVIGKMQAEQQQRRGQ